MLWFGLGPVDISIDVLSVKIGFIRSLIFVIFPTTIGPSMNNLPLKQLTIYKLLFFRPVFHHLLFSLHLIPLLCFLIPHLLSLSLLDNILIDP